MLILLKMNAVNVAVFKLRHYSNLLSVGINIEKKAILNAKP